MPDSRLIGEVPEELLSENLILQADAVEGSVIPALEMPVFYDDPFNTRAYSFVPTDKPLVFEELIALVERVIAQAQTDDQILHKVAFAGEFPSESMESLGVEVITWRLISRQPASMGPHGTGAKMPQWQQHYSLRIPDSPTKVVSVERRLVDHVLALTCWSHTARLANDRVLWLERLMVNNTWVFQSKGADFFQWKRRQADTYSVVPSGDKWYARTLEFDIRLPEFRLSSNPMIQTVVTQLGPQID